jgi:hypothetical protein
MAQLKVIVNRSAKDMARNIARGYMLATPICVISSFLRPSFFDLITAIETNIANFVLIFTFQVFVRLMVEIVNSTTMQPINLPLTASCASGSKSASEQKSMINAIASEDALLKIFGFYALNRIARGNEFSRSVIYALSEPGKKPRNWNIVFEVCVRVINVVQEDLQLSTPFMETHLGPMQKANIASRGKNVSPTISSYYMMLSEYSLDSTYMSMQKEFIFLCFSALRIGFSFHSRGSMWNCSKGSAHNHFVVFALGVGY